MADDREEKGLTIRMQLTIHTEMRKSQEGTVGF
jgi:hypothetical protein